MTDTVPIPGKYVTLLCPAAYLPGAKAAAIIRIRKITGLPLHTCKLISESTEMQTVIVASWAQLHNILVSNWVMDCYRKLVLCGVQVMQPRQQLIDSIQSVMLQAQELGMNELADQISMLLTYEILKTPRES